MMPSGPGHAGLLDSASVTTGLQDSIGWQQTLEVNTLIADTCCLTPLLLTGLAQHHPAWLWCRFLWRQPSVRLQLLTSRQCAGPLQGERATPWFILSTTMMLCWVTALPESLSGSVQQSAPSFDPPLMSDHLVSVSLLCTTILHHLLLCSGCD